MTKEKITWAIVGLVIGVVFGSQISQLPLVNRIPRA